MHQFINSLSVNDNVEAIYLVKTASSKLNKNNSPYLDMTLCDKTGEINAKVWNFSGEAPKDSSYVGVKGTVTDFNRVLQLKLDKFMPIDKSQVNESDYVKTAPEKPETMLAVLYKTTAGFKNAYLRDIVNLMLKKYEDRLLYYPAAQRMHHAELAGLLHHITSMLAVGDALVNHYTFLNRELLLSGIILHDLGKIDELISSELGIVSEYSLRGNLLGHLVDGANTLGLANDRLRERELKSRGLSSTEEIQAFFKEFDDKNGEYLLLLQHMLISHHGTLEFGSAKLPMFPEAVMLNLIDNMDARMYMLENQMENLSPGSISLEKVFGLDTKIYHPNYSEE